jgi:hypothetical protein
MLPIFVLIVDVVVPIVVAAAVLVAVVAAHEGRFCAACMCVKGLRRWHGATIC